MSTRHSIPAKSRKLDAFYNAAESADDLVAAIERAANRLKGLMEQVHGPCRIDINHEDNVGFLIIARDRQRPIASPRRGEIA